MRFFLFSAVVLLAVACSDTERDAIVSPVVDSGETSTAQDRAIRIFPISPPAHQRLAAACFVSRRISREPVWYEYRTRPIYLHYSFFERAQGAWEKLEYRERDPAGRITFLANCTLPKAPGAQQIALHVLGLSSGSEISTHSFGLGESSYSTSSSDAILLEEVHNHCAVHPSDPMCEVSGTEEEPTYDPPPPAPYEEGDGGNVAGGGEDPCEFCIPEPDDWDEQCPNAGDPACDLRTYAYQTDGERIALRAIPAVLRQHGCGQLAEIFEDYVLNDRVALFDARLIPPGATGPMYGQMTYVAPGQIRIWTGYNKHQGDDVNWTRTAAHEAIHVLYPDWEDGTGQIEPLAEACAGYP